MAVKVYDTISPASNSFPALMAEHVNLVREDGTTDSIQNLFNNKELGAGGDTSTVLTSDEYENLPEEERLNNSYYLYDIGVHYKNGIAYSRKEPISLTMAEYKALEEVDPDQEYIVSADAEGILLEASDIGYSNAVSNLPCTTVQGAVDKVAEKVDGLISDTTTSETSTWSSSKIASEINPTIDRTDLFPSNELDLNLLYNRCGTGVYDIVGQGSAGHGMIRADLWAINNGTICYIVSIMYSDGSSSTVGGNINAQPTVPINSKWMSVINKLTKIGYL